MQVKVSAPGKIHLCGEHAIVYGEPAILAAVGKRCFVEVEKSDKVKISFKYDTGFYEDEISVKQTKGIGKEAVKLWQEGSKSGDFSKMFDFAKGNKFGWVSIGYLLNKMDIDSGLSLKIDQQIPLGSGLGSSSAYSVAASMAFSKLFGKDCSIETVNKLAYGLERFKHGTPGGGDNSTCCYGGLVWFQKNMQVGHNTIISLNKEIPYELRNFILVFTGEPEKGTGELVQMVRNHDPKFRDPRIKRIGEISREMRAALKKKDMEKIKSLISEDWSLLRDFGLSTPAADKLVDKIKKIDGASKLCGACGGGIMLSCHEDIAKLKSTIKSAGFQPMDVKLGVEGVRVEN